MDEESILPQNKGTREFLNPVSTRFLPLDVCTVRRMISSSVGYAATFPAGEGLYCDRKQDGVIFKGFSEMEKLSPKVTDEGAEFYGMRNQRTLIRRLRRHLLYHREGFSRHLVQIKI